MNVNINGKGLRIIKHRNLSKERTCIEIEELLGSTVNDNGDEVAQFQADQFIADQFCMVWPKHKFPKQATKRPAEVIALQGHTEYVSSYEMDDNHNREECAPIGVANHPVLDVLLNSSSNESNIELVDLTNVKAKELDILLKESFEAYHLGQYGLALAKYRIAWEMITGSNLKRRVEHINDDIVCYMLCLSLLETDQLNNMLEAVELLVALEKRSSHIFPAVYYALSKAHYKHCRFALALDAIHQGLAFLESDIDLSEYTIPGSDVTLKESTKDGLSVSLAAMKDECSKWHPPDAVCCMGECLPSSRWYVPNRDIYFRDPAFNGMVVLTCSNARNPCTMKFHQACWKAKKDQLSALKKLSDKDIIGYECFTPNCEHGQGARSLITRVEVYGDDGKLKTHIEPPVNPVVWMKRRSSPKGAIPKQQVKTKRYTEKVRRPVPTAGPRSSCKETACENRVEKAWRLTQLTKLRRNNFGIKPGYEWRPDMKMYGNPQMKEIGDFLGGPIFENDCSELVAIKTFIFTYFYEFIKENGCIKKRDISQKWKEDKFIFEHHNDVLPGETDICEFLLQSYKLASLGDYIGIAENLPELYAIVRNEVCSCLRFLLADPLHSRSAVIQGNVPNKITSDNEEKKNKHQRVLMDSGPEMTATVRVDKSQQANMTPPLTLSPESLQSTLDTNVRQWSDDDQLSENVMTQVISSFAESKSSSDPTDLDEVTALSTICHDRLEFENSTQSERIYDSTHNLECLQNDNFDGGLGNDMNSCQTGSGPGDAKLVEVSVDFKEGILHRVSEPPQDSGRTNGLRETKSEKASPIYGSAAGNCQLDGVRYCITGTSLGTEELKISHDSTAVKGECIGTQNDFSNGMEPVHEGTLPDNTHIADLELPEGSHDNKQNCISLTGTTLVETFSAAQCQDTLAESNVKKIENDLAVMVKTVAQLKSVLEQNQTRSENHVQMLQLELLNHKTVSQESMSELVKDLSRLEARCAELESEKSEIIQKLQKRKLDLRQSNNDNIDLTLKNTELMHNHDKLSEEKKDIEHNFNLLLMEKSVMENQLKMLQRERDKMDEKLQKYQALLEDKSSFESEPMSRARVEQRILDATRLNERKLKLQALNHEFSINIHALEKASEKCYDHVIMLTDVSKLVTLVTSQQFIVTEAEAAWQTCGYRVRETMERYKEDYSKLKALLESNEQIQNLSDINLPTLNIVFPQLPNLTELYYKGKVQFGHHQTPLLPPLWNTQEAYHQGPRGYASAASAFFLDQNWGPRLNDRFHTANGAHNLGQEARNNDLRGAGFDREGNMVQQGPMSIADTQDLNSRVVQDDPSSYDAENDDEEVLQASCCTGVGSMSPISVNRRSTSLKKIGRDLLIQELRRKFVGVPEHDLLESLQIVRERHNNTLSGMRVQDIIQESEPFIKQRQAKHMASYSPSEQTLPPERLPPRSNKPSNRKLPPAIRLGQQKKICGSTQEQVNKLANHPSNTIPPAIPASMKKRAWQPVPSGLVKWKKNQEDSECTICMESMNAYDKTAPIYTLPCQHSFHTVCIKKWLGESSVCPMCMQHCTMDDEFPPLPS